MPPNVINYNLAIRALGKGGDWERATGLLEEMKEAGVSPDERTFNAAIEVRTMPLSVFFSPPLSGFNAEIGGEFNAVIEASLTSLGVSWCP